MASGLKRDFERGSLEWIILNRSDIRIDSPILKLRNNEWYFCLYHNPFITPNFYCFVTRRKISSDENFRVRAWVDLMYPEPITDIGHIDHSTNTKFNDFCYLRIPSHMNVWRILKLKITLIIWKIENIDFPRNANVNYDRLRPISKKVSPRVPNSDKQNSDNENDVKGAEKLFTMYSKCVLERSTCDTVKTLKETAPLERSEYSESHMENSSVVGVGTSNENDDVKVMDKSMFLEAIPSDLESSFDNLTTSDALPEDSERSAFEIQVASATLHVDPKNVLKSSTTYVDAINEGEANRKFKDTAINEEKANSTFKDLHSLKMLSADLTAVLKSQRFCDAVIVTKDMNFNVHRVILSERSSKFAKMFQIDDTPGKVEIPIHDIRGSVMKEMLFYIYSGQMKDSMSFDMHLDLLRAAERYCLPDLKFKCGHQMMKRLKVNNVCDVASCARKYQVSELFIAAKKFIDSNIALVLTSDGWVRLLGKNPFLAFEIAQTFKT